MAEDEKEKKSALGLGLPGNAGNPSAWRPSKAVRRAEAGFSLTDAIAEKTKAGESRVEASAESLRASAPDAAISTTEARERADDAAAWRPSKVNEERLSSVSPLRARKRFAMSPRARLVFAAVFLAITAYFFVELWFMPDAGELHVVLVIAAVVILLLFVSAVLGATARRRRRTRDGDDQSILRL